MSIEPKKLKNHIGDIKGCLDSLPTNPDKSSLLICFKLLLCAELCQRGIIFPLDVIKEDSKDINTKLMESIQTVAGKVMIDEAVVPKPLVAGAAVVSSMLAEKLSDIMFSLAPDTSTMGVFTNKESESALKRCDEVNDERLKILVNLGRQDFLEDKFSASSTIKCYETVALLLLRISLGNQFRAASFSNPDQPPMWKRSLDLCVKLNLDLFRLKQESSYNQENRKLKRHDYNEDIYEAFHIADATFPLKNLIRIAESKGNSKRVSELSLRLVESLICQKDYITFSIFCDVGKLLWNDLNLIFVADYLPKHLTNDDSNKMSLIEEGRKTLKKIDISSIDSTKLKLLHQILSMRAECVYENQVIESVSEFRLDAAKNRAETTLKSLASQSRSSNTLLLEARRDVLTNSLTETDTAVNYNDSELEGAAKILQETVFSISIDTLTQTIREDMLNDIYYCLENHIERLVTKAQAFSIKTKKSSKCESMRIGANKAWVKLQSFVEGFLQHSKELKDSHKILASQMNLFKTASQTFFLVNWMRQNAPTDPNAATNYLMYHKDVLDKKELNEVKKAKQENVIKTSGDEPDNVEMKDIMLCILAGRCISFLSKSSSKDEDYIEECEKISLKAKENSKIMKVSGFQASHGIPFLMCLVCWSGLYNNPWPFCNVSTARAIIQAARESLQTCEKEWGRKTSPIEKMIINLAEADAECGFLSGGFTKRSQTLYQQILSEIQGIEEKDTSILLRSHCLSGMTKLCLSQATSNSEISQQSLIKATEDALACVESLTSLEKSLDAPSLLNICMISGDFKESIEFLLCQLRTLIAESMIRSSKFVDAEIFLKQAVTESPDNFYAAFALGAFWFRMSLHDRKNASSDDVYRNSQIQLLKSLKIDCTKPDPFAVLGLWYEMKNDIKRAIGCYSKALLIDPSHPIAGRGILRLGNAVESTEICLRAIRVSSNTNGWAWKALADYKAFSDGSDEEAIWYYQQALRCRDIEGKENHFLSVFFTPSFELKHSQEYTDTWAALASSYRRLGKFSACLRAYESAFEAGGNCDEYLCMCAQVELDLGLLDDAASKFGKALLALKCFNSKLNASYGFASCMLLSANRNVDEGKNGAALSNLHRGIECVKQCISDNTTFDFMCLYKLLGDLYSHGYKIPASNFENLSVKVDFVRLGESTYRQLLKKIENDTKSSDNKVLLSSAMNDIGTNILLQAYLLCDTSMKDYKRLDEKTKVILSRAQHFFVSAIELNQYDSHAWLGLGCSLCALDTILSQHAFCRALQLDKSSQDAWVNLSFMYCEQSQFKASECTIDALTQIGDTPLMWIARALLLEKATKSETFVEDKLDSIADAYRACLQTTRNSEAFLGLGLNFCRRLVPNYKLQCDDVSRKESEACLVMYLNATGDKATIPRFIQALTTFENDNMDENANDLISSVLSRDGTVTDTRAGKQKMKPITVTIKEAQLNVRLDPDNGEKWLELAKLLLHSFTNIKRPSQQSFDLLLDVVERSKYIMKSAVTEPVTIQSTLSPSVLLKSALASPVKAAKLSDAHSLSSWIAQENNRLSACRDRQRALLLDPENSYARGQLNI